MKPYFALLLDPLYVLSYPDAPGL
eukprot:COSAG02_NODE_62485_length_265_cov_3.746988_1_plen_23_part_10